MCSTLTTGAHQPTNKCMNRDELYAELGGMIASRRKRVGFTQAEAAKLAGMSRAALANIEVGRQNLSVHQLYALAAALKLESPSLLLPVGALERPVKASELSIYEPNLNERQRDQVERVFQAVGAARRTEGTS